MDWRCLMLGFAATIGVTAAVRFPTDADLGPDQDEEESMWPYPTYKPISWDKYYAHDIHDKHLSLTSGLAAGITIGVFFAVFLLTFGCRLYSQRHDSTPRSCSQRSSITVPDACGAARRLSVSDLFRCVPAEPPPPYEVAIQMPAQGQPPPFTALPVQGERTVQSGPPVNS